MLEPPEDVQREFDEELAAYIGEWEEEFRKHLDAPKEDAEEKPASF